MQYSRKAIFKALMMTLAKKSHNDFEKFLIQQNWIQFQLISLIVLGAKKADMKFLKWVENQTIGNLIPLYKVCAIKEASDLSLIRFLEIYNKKRIYLVHKLLTADSYTKIESELKAANKIGTEIINRLETIWIKEFVNRVGKPLAEYKNQKRAQRTLFRG